jgi:hypothetical protein
MKEKEPESFLEKDRKHRDRTKKRRLTADEKASTDETVPRMEPYKRSKNWVNQLDEE